MWIVEIPLKYDRRLARTIKTDKDLDTFPRESPRTPKRQSFKSKAEALRVKEELEKHGIRGEVYFLDYLVNEQSRAANEK